MRGDEDDLAAGHQAGAGGGAPGELPIITIKLLFDYYSIIILYNVIIILLSSDYRSIIF